MAAIDFASLADAVSEDEPCGPRYHLAWDPGIPASLRLCRAVPVGFYWGRGRVGALAPDVSPHWAGGLMDWGTRRVKLPTGSEIGHLYGAFLLDLCNWLSARVLSPPGRGTG